MKFGITAYTGGIRLVAPFVGAWIEIVIFVIYLLQRLVAPFVGAWIEIYECCRNPGGKHVAPFVGAWIEIAFAEVLFIWLQSRSLRGSVD